jgi:hypothetical protein
VRLVKPRPDLTGPTTRRGRVVAGPAAGGPRPGTDPQGCGYPGTGSRLGVLCQSIANDRAKVWITGISISGGGP